MSNVVDLFAAHATDASAEKAGVLTQLPDCGDTLFRIARANTIKYAELLQKRVKAHNAVLKSRGEVAAELGGKIMAEVMSKTILLGWEGEISFKGEKHVYSREVAQELLMMEEFRKKVMAFAEDAQEYKLVKEEEEEKN